MLSRTQPPDDWWPDWLRDVADEDPLASDRVVVAEVGGRDADHHNSRHLYTALAPMTRRDAILRRRGGIGHDVSASGPHPVDYRGAWDYTPRFWVEATTAMPRGLEPLVVSWQANNRTVLWPDQGFLMTYGLIPRLVASTDGATMHWDDPAAPRSDVVVADLVSAYSFPVHDSAVVRVARDFLQDYATIRHRALVQVYYAQRVGPLSDDIRRVLGDKQVVEFRLKGRLLDLRLLPGERESPVLAQAWGVRPLLRPGPSPISAGRWEYGALTWPGFSAPITDDAALRLGMSAVAYVRDSVLAPYEGRPEFTIHPESGSVSRGNQWSVSPTRRVGRNLIAVDLKKLYEGTPPETVRHWHAEAVPPPPDPYGLDMPNVGTRSRRIVYGVAHLGEAIAQLATLVLTQSPTSRDITGLDRAELDDSGWWTAGHVEPVARHIPLALSKGGFLARCNDLYKLVVEGLSEKWMRRTLLAVGVPSDDIKELRSLKLLDHLARLAELANQSGLLLREDGAILHGRLADEPVPSLLAPLFALTALRQLADHRAVAGERAKWGDALKPFGLDASSYTSSGWGMASDAVYDRVADTLEAVAATLETAAHSL